MYCDLLRNFETRRYSGLEDLRGKDEGRLKEASGRKGTTVSFEIIRDANVNLNCLRNKKKNTEYPSLNRTFPIEFIKSSHANRVEK